MDPIMMVPCPDYSNPIDLPRNNYYGDFFNVITPYKKLLCG